MLISEYDYELPKNLIAQLPAEKRQNSKMMVLNRTDKSIQHKHFYDIVDLIDSNSILVLNDTKVLPARIFGVKSETGAKIEILLLNPENYDFKSNIWQCLIRPSKRVQIGTVVKICNELSVEVLKPLEDDGEWLVKLIYTGDLFDILHKVGIRNGFLMTVHLLVFSPSENNGQKDKGRYPNNYISSEFHRFSLIVMMLPVCATDSYIYKL